MTLLSKFKRLLSRREPHAGKTEGTHAPPVESELLPGDYWHFTSSSSVYFLFNNVMAGKGWLDSMSATRRKHGGHLITLGDIYPLAGAETEAICFWVNGRLVPTFFPAFQAARSRLASSN
jgi:hypothetical protein